MTIVLGIDPGSRVTGYGLVAREGSELEHIESGIIRLGDLPMPLRLRKLHIELTDLLENFDIDRFAIETSFVAENPQTALKLGQARGVAIAACALYDLEFAEYSPRAIKSATVGTGRADKDQVQFMVKLLLNLSEPPTHDAADALAVAICDLNSMRFHDSVAQIHGP